MHTLASYALAAYGIKGQQVEHLPAMLGGGLLGAYCLSEPASARTRPRCARKPCGTTTTGSSPEPRPWITHGGVADFYTVMARTGEEGPRGITAFLVPGDADGLSAAQPEKKMGMKGSPTAQVHLDGVRVSDDRRIGDEGQGFAIALAALDSGRLGIAACAIGLAQAALDEAVGYAVGRRQFGRPIADFQGLRFMLADMATQIEAGRALYLTAARLRDAGRPFAKQAAMAKLHCTRHRDEGDHRRRPDPRRVRLHAARLPGQRDKVRQSEGTDRSSAPSMLRRGAGPQPADPFAVTGSSQRGQAPGSLRGRRRRPRTASTR
ncbi:Acyl-CoA dehydrogenase OS=Streptomyces alboniger OX=132473 GN=CP975_05260 PE=3 SV=1 [Streptomyces alboniger]